MLERELNLGDVFYWVASKNHPRSLDVDFPDRVIDLHPDRLRVVEN
mgnify:FL=1